MSTSDPADRYVKALQALRRLDRAHRKSIRLAATRHSLPPGSSRARVTTANARWAQAAEMRDRDLDAFENELVALGFVK